MRVDIITAVPELLESPFGASIVQRAKDAGLVEIHVHNLRDYGIGNYKQIDDYQFGGGAGMVMMAEPLANCIDDLKAITDYDEVIYMTPDGTSLNQSTSNTLSSKASILIICGHYKGIDERIREAYVTMEISIGDYVLSGGELAAAVLVDSLVRLLPGVLGDETSALTDSFQDGLLSPPVYTRPREWRGMSVPEVLTSGHLKAIDEWRLEQAHQRTKERRPDLLD
jgi:tRNA (guanine37-N1)-methyltransferase